MQENESSSLLASSQGFIHVQNKHKQGEIAFFFYRMPDTTTADACIVFRYKGIKLSDSKNGIALHRIPLV